MNTSPYFITSAQYQTLSTLLINDDRTAFYVELHNMTGSSAALDMAEISSSSNIIGGVAWSLNSAYSESVTGYPPGGVPEFSRAIANYDFASFVLQADGRWMVPSDYQTYENARIAWNQVGNTNGVQGLGDNYFPGNLLLALHYLEDLDISSAYQYFSLETFISAAGRSFFESLGELVADDTNYTNSLNDLLNRYPGTTNESYTSPFGIDLIITKDATGKTINITRDEGVLGCAGKLLDGFNNLIEHYVNKLNAGGRWIGGTMFDLLHPSTAGNSVLSAAEDFGDPHSGLLWPGTDGDGGWATGSGGSLGDVLDGLRDLLRRAGIVASPLVLDLDGNGVQTTARGEVQFDHDGNRLAEQTGWVGHGDGLLVRDVNGNGSVDSGAELFGNYTVLPGGIRATNGFEALRALDANSDGKLNAQDSAFTELRVWVDSNSNGFSEPGELQTLQQVGVESLSTAYVNASNQSEADSQGNQHRQLGSFTRVDGSTAAMNDVWFSVDNARTVEIDQVEISSAIAALPDLAGLGGVHSLRQSMALDNTGRLQSLLQSFVSGVGNGAPATRVQAETILLAWTGADLHETTSRGAYLTDARRLYVLEAMLGENFATPAGQSDPVGPVAADLVNKAFDSLLDRFYTSLMEQSWFRPLNIALQLGFDNASGKFIVNVGAAVDLIQLSYALNPEGASTLVGEWGRYLNRLGDLGELAFDALSAAGNPNGQGLDLLLFNAGYSRNLGTYDANSLVGNSAAEMLMGLDGNDTLTGAGGNDVLRGGAGNDILWAGGSSDVLDGGEGNDFLGLAFASNGQMMDLTFIGGKGNDTIVGGSFADNYRFELGDGADIVTDLDMDLANLEGDVLSFGHGVASANVTPIRIGEDLVLQLANGVDQVTVKKWFDSSSYEIEQIAFEDRTHWTSAQVNERALAVFRNATAGTTVGTANMDLLAGTAGSIDVLRGMEGNDVLNAVGSGDTLEGGDGNDILASSTPRDASTFIGGNGNDTIIGSIYADTYIFNLGDGADIVSDPGLPATGNDILRFGAGIAATDISPIRNGIDLIFKHLNGADQVTIKYWFSDTNTRIERIEFANGTLWTSAEVDAMAMKVIGTDGSDSLTGLSGFVDVLLGMGGNDTLLAAGNGDILDGGDGDDSLGVSGSLLISGTTFIGGRGNDSIAGTNYGDVYIFALGDGEDSILDPGPTNLGNDVVRFTSGVEPGDISPIRSGLDLVLQHANGTDQVTVKNWFVSAVHAVERIEFASGTIWTGAQVQARALELFGTPGADTLTGLSNYTDVLRGQGGDDSLYAVGNNDILDGGDGNDWLGVSGSLNISGTIFSGGHGNDTVSGSNFADTYLFNSGDGADIIIDTGAAALGNDALKFGTGIAVTDITPTRLGLDMVFQHANGTDQVTVRNWFASSSNQIERIHFADNTVWTNSQASTRALEVFGTSAADTLIGLSSYSDTLRGLEGNDTLLAVGNGDILDGGDGNDVLGISGSNYIRNTTYIGGRGSDTITGSVYADLFLFNQGDGFDSIFDPGPANFGNDVLRFESGLSSIDITPIKAGSDLIFKHVNNSDQVTVKNWYTSSKYQIERIEFSSGGLWESVLLGTSAADSINGTTVSDFIQGSTGNDTLTGGLGSDTYRFGLGDGIDIVQETQTNTNDVDVVQFSGSINANQLWFSQAGNNLVVSIIGTGDRISVQDWYLDTRNQVEQFRTSDGKFLLQSQVQNLVNAMASYSPPAAGQTSLPADYADSLNLVIIGNWY